MLSTVCHWKATCTCHAERREASETTPSHRWAARCFAAAQHDTSRGVFYGM